MGAPTPSPGYLVVRVDDEGTYTGGLMVTDEHGLPLDFRYTDPVTPTRLQRVLYGGALDRYLRSEVVLRTLLKALEKKPTMLVVDDDRMLDEDAGMPVVMLAATNVAAIGPPGARQEEASGAVVLQVGDDEPPVRMTVRPRDPQTVGRIADDLVRMGEGMQVLEPADRVRGALDLIASGGADS